MDNITPEEKKLANVLKKAGFTNLAMTSWKQTSRNIIAQPTGTYLSSQSEFIDSEIRSLLPKDVIQQ